MTLPNAAKPPSGVTRPSPAERVSADPGQAAVPDRSLWSSILEAGAPPTALEPILGSSSVRVQLEALGHLDKDATAQQRAFRSELTIANLCLMVAGVLSGLVLASAPLVPGENPGWWAWLPRCIGVATLALGAIAALHTYKAREGNRLQRWLSARSGAEMARSGVFMTIAERAAAGSSEIALAALELVNRGLLENQRAWFRQRADQHRRSSDWTTSWGGLGTALAFVGGSGAVIASFAPNQTWLAVAGVIGAAVGAYAVNRESLRLDRANAGATRKRPPRSTPSRSATTPSRPRSGPVSRMRCGRSRRRSPSSFRPSTNAGSKAARRPRPCWANWTGSCASSLHKASHPLAATGPLVLSLVGPVRRLGRAKIEGGHR